MQQQNRVVPAPNRSARIENSVLTVELPAISWTALHLIK
jgi:alpha-N-arabinofuranosidase